MAFIEKHRRVFLAAGMAVCVAAIVLTLRPGYTPTLIEKALGYVVAPLQKGAAAVIRGVGGFFGSLTEMDGLRAENAALKDANNRLAIENQRLKLADEENIRLSALLQIDQKYAELPKIGAEIIGKDPNDWYDSFHIDRGTDHGLTKNMAVLGSQGLVGVIREVYPNFSKVVSIIDHRFAAAVKITRTGDLGVVKGDLDLMPQGLCRMDYIDARAQIMAGDEILTSNHSSIFPPGILVGTVLRVEANPDGLTQRVVVQPASQVGRIETVLVVTRLFGDTDAEDGAPVFLED